MSDVKEKIQLFGIMMLMKVAYQYILRPLLKQAIDNPDETWDETVMEIVDRLFNYTESK